MEPQGPPGPPHSLVGGRRCLVLLDLEMLLGRVGVLGWQGKEAVGGGREWRRGNSRGAERRFRSDAAGVLRVCGSSWLCCRRHPGWGRVRLHGWQSYHLYCDAPSGCTPGMSEAGGGGSACEGERGGRWESVQVVLDMGTPPSGPGRSHGGIRHDPSLGRCSCTTPLARAGWLVP